MARGDNLARRLLTRIAESQLRLTVMYPGMRPAVTGPSPTSGPRSPLTGAAPTQTVYPVAPTPQQGSAELPCLWYDATASVGSSLRQDGRTASSVGWIAGATALAQVAVTDAALDPADYLGKTVFTACEAVEFMGHRYRVLAVQPVAAGHRTPTTYYVWLSGTEVQ